MHCKSIVAVLVLSLSVACSRDPEKLKTEYVASGDRFVAEKKYSEAIIQYKNAIAQDPRFGEARFKLAKASEANGDALTALREYVRAADLLPNDVAVQLRAAQVLFIARQYPEAKARVDAVLQKDPKNAEALILLGNSLAGLKDFDGAISELEEAIDTDPRRTPTYANVGVLQLAKGDTKAAEGAFKRAVEVNAKSISAHLSLANFYWSANRLDEAEAEFKAAQALDPKSPVVLRGISAFYVITRRNLEAESTLKAYAAATKAVEPRLMLADFYLNSGRTADATAILEPLAKDTNGFGAATTRLAALAYAANRHEDAYRMVDSVLEQLPKDEQAQLLKVRFLLSDKKPAEALAIANVVAKDNAASLQGLYYKGLALAANGERDSAIDVLNELLRRVPSAFPVQLKLAELYIGRGDYKPASELAGQAVKARPSSGQAHLLVAQAALGLGNLQQANSELKLIAASNPDAAEVHTMYGSVYLRTRQLDRARQSYERALQLQPNLLPAVYGLVQADLAEKKTDAVRARMDMQVQKTPADPAMLTLAGNALAAVGDTRKAETLLRKAVELDPANLDAYASLGNLYLDENRLDEARQEFETLARQHPDTAVAARTMVAIILDLKKQPDAARSEYQKVLDMDPRAAVASNNLAWAYADKGDSLDTALQLAQTAKSQLPNNAEVNDTLGWIYYKKGLTTLAVAALREGASQAPANPLIHYHLGLAYMKAGDRVEARRSLEQALKLNPSFAEAEDAKRALNTLKG